MPFTAKLLMISPWLLLILINATFIAFSLIIAVIIKLCFPYEMRKSHNDVATAIYTRAAAIYSIMLAFVVVLLWQQYHRAADNALKEGKEAVQLYRDLRIYPDKEQAAPAVKALLEFVRSVIEEEYPAMGQMRTSPDTEQDMNNLSVSLAKIQAKNPQEQMLFARMLRNLDNLSNLRDNRLMDMDSSLPDILWAAILIGGGVTIIFSNFLGAEKFWLHALFTALLVIIIATTVFLIIELDYPFMGVICAKPTSYIKLLQTIK
jgi:hypothetical protein